MFKALMAKRGKRRSAKALSHALYGAVVARARDPRFYRDMGVPDTFDGRFEMMALHIYLLMGRLGDEKAPDETAQLLYDAFMDDMAAGLREAGVGDTIVPKRLRKMSRVFYGRAKAWDNACADKDPEAALSAVHLRNLFAGEEIKTGSASRLARYMRDEMTKLGAINLDDPKAQSKPFGAGP